MLRALLSSCVALLCAFASDVRAARSPDGNAQPPAEVVIKGAGTVPLAAHATRSYLLDTVDLYSLAVYVAGPMDRRRLASPDVAKALRIEVTYVEDLHRPMPLDWRRELEPRLEPAGTAHLRGTFAPLQHGDVIQIEYVPRRGTSIRVNARSAADNASHDVMLAFLDHWVGQRPVSEEVKRELLAAP
jgi:hypothetical protein